MLRFPGTQGITRQFHSKKACKEASTKIAWALMIEERNSSKSSSASLISHLPRWDRLLQQHAKSAKQSGEKYQDKIAAADGVKRLRNLIFSVPEVPEILEGALRAANATFQKLGDLGPALSRAGDPPRAFRKRPSSSCTFSVKSSKRVCPVPSTRLPAAGFSSLKAPYSLPLSGPFSSRDTGQDRS